MFHYLKALRHYADFSGRASRAEYWMFTLFNIIFGVLAMFVDCAIGCTLGEMHYGIIFYAYFLAVLVPWIAVSVRRLHDISKSGWMILVALIPLVGVIWLLLLFITDSYPAENFYGDCPKDLFII